MELVSESLLFFMKRTLILCLVKEDIGMIWELGVGKVALWKKESKGLITLVRHAQKRIRSEKGTMPLEIVE